MGQQDAAAVSPYIWSCATVPIFWAGADSPADQALAGTDRLFQHTGFGLRITTRFIRAILPLETCNLAHWDYKNRSRQRLKGTGSLPADVGAHCL